MATREDVYEKFGFTAEAAQLLETELGTLLLAQHGLEKGLWDETKAREAATILDRINSQTLGRLLREIKAKSEIDPNMVDILNTGLALRNRLFHSFYREHGRKIETDKGRDAMIEDLEQMHTEILTSYQLASAMSSLAVDFVLKLKARNA